MRRITLGSPTETPRNLNMHNFSGHTNKFIQGQQGIWHMFYRMKTGNRVKRSVLKRQVLNIGTHINRKRSAHTSTGRDLSISTLTSAEQVQLLPTSSRIGGQL